jgi:hypothetical protein
MFGLLQVGLHPEVADRVSCGASIAAGAATLIDPAAPSSEPERDDFLRHE